MIGATPDFALKMPLRAECRGSVRSEPKTRSYSQWHQAVSQTLGSRLLGGYDVDYG
jgi:hypothetical protein